GGHARRGRKNAAGRDLEARELRDLSRSGSAEVLDDGHPSSCLGRRGRDQDGRVQHDAAVVRGAHRRIALPAETVQVRPGHRVQRGSHPGKGSAIFLHANTESMKTAGCVSMYESSLVKTMEWEGATKTQIAIH